MNTTGNLLTTTYITSGLYALSTRSCFPSLELSYTATESQCCSIYDSFNCYYNEVTKEYTNIQTGGRKNS